MRDGVKRAILLGLIFLTAGIATYIVRETPRTYGLFDLLGRRKMPTANSPTLRPEDFTPRTGPILDSQDVQGLLQLNRERSRLYKEVAPSVVSIHTATAVTLSPAPPSVPDTNGRAFLSGLGSGVIISREGHVLTNYHVVTNNGKVVSKIVIILHDGSRFGARVIGFDRAVDIAILRVEESVSANREFNAIPYGDSEQVEICETVMAIGTPYGLSETVTIGIISGKQREINDATPALFQISAIVNPGSSGGPLVNIRGEMIGLIARIVTNRDESGGWQGIGLAVPSNDVKRAANSILSKGKVIFGYLGVKCDNLSPAIARQLKLHPTQSGVVVVDTVDSSPAESVLKPDDVVIGFNGEIVANKKQLFHLIQMSPVGREIKLLVFRGGRKREIKVRIGERKNMKLPESGESENRIAHNILQMLGMSVRDLTAVEMERIGKEPAIFVKDVLIPSPASKARLHPACLIHRFNGREVHSTEEFFHMIRATRGEVIILGVRDKNGQFFENIRLIVP